MDTLQPQLDRTSASQKRSAIKIGTATTRAEEAGKEVEISIYTVTLGEQTIELLPFKNWIQLDVHKWVVQGKLPASPAGLEVTLDHVKVAGETVLHRDPDGCAKLERVFNEWLELERGTLEMAQKRLHSKAVNQTTPSLKRHESQPLHYHVQVDQQHQVHIQCLQGREVLASIGLNVPGFNSLADQGLLRKPRNLKVGVLHDWVELDGMLYSFEKGKNDGNALERVLNERYLSNLALGQGKDVVVFANAASSTGFDIQFTALQGGVPDNRRRPLNEDTLELLQDPNRCGLLQSGLVVKLTRPTIIFKQKTSDGGERYLEQSALNTVFVGGDTGVEKEIDLSQPVNYLRLSAVELSTVFNHPAINKHGQQPGPSIAQPAETKTTSPKAFPITKPFPRVNSPISSEAQSDQTPFELPGAAVSTSTGIDEVMTIPLETSRIENVPTSRVSPSLGTGPKEKVSLTAAENLQPVPEAVREQPAVNIDGPESLPNRWLKGVLAQPPIRFDWFSCLIYDKIAEHFGNSQQGQIGPMSCWAVALSEAENLEAPTFKGIFLTEKHGLGFINHGHMVRFYRGVVFIGTHESAQEGIGIDLVGVGVDAEQRIVFIVTDDYLTKFDGPERAIAEELLCLKENGAVVLSVTETLHGCLSLEILWTVPADQQNPIDPQPLESIPAS